MTRPLLVWAAALAAAAASCGPPAAVPPAGEPAADPRADASQNVQLVGHNDLQGRESLVVVAKSDAANGNWVYVGHHENLWDETQKLNDLNGKMEWNGTSILDVADRGEPEARVAHSQRSERQFAQRVCRVRLLV